MQTARKQKKSEDTVLVKTCRSCENLELFEEFHLINLSDYLNQLPIEETTSKMAAVISATNVWLFQMLQLLKLLAAIANLAWHCVQKRAIFWWDKERKKKFIEHVNEAAHMKESLLNIEDWQDTLFTWPMFKQECKMLYLDLYKSVHLHGPAKDVALSKLDETPCNLFDFAKEGRPLVLNFGSCS